jgi:hypothetical protein
MSQEVERREKLRQMGGQKIAAPRNVEERQVIILRFAIPSVNLGQHSRRICQSNAAAYGKYVN